MKKGAGAALSVMLKAPLEITIVDHLGNGDLPPWSHFTHRTLVPICRLDLMDLIRGRDAASNLVETHTVLGDDVGAENLDEGFWLLRREPYSLIV